MQDQEETTITEEVEVELPPLDVDDVQEPEMPVLDNESVTEEWIIDGTEEHELTDEQIVKQPDSEQASEPEVEQESESDNGVRRPPDDKDKDIE